MSRDTDRRSRSRSRTLTKLAAAAALALACATADAAGRTWDGGAGTQNWNTANNWNPNVIPSNADNVLIGVDTANVSLSAAGLADNLTLNTGAFLSTSGQPLIVDADTVLEKTTGSAVRLLVNGGALLYDFQTGSLDIKAGAGLQMMGGDARIGSRIDVDATSVLVGQGRIDFATTATGRGSVAMAMQGLILTTGDTLMFRRVGAGATGTLSLNGVGTNKSQVEVMSGTSRLSVQMPVSDFTGNMFIGNGNTAQFTMGFGLDETGTIHMAGDASSVFPAILDVSGSAGIAGTLHAHAGFSDVNASVGFSSTTKVIVDADALLRFNEHTSYSGGSYTGAGFMFQNASSAINGDTTIGHVHVYDWDGAGESSTMIINPFKHLTIDADFIDLPGGGFDGIVSIDAGHITVNTPAPWKLNGSMNIKGLVDTPTVNGSQIQVYGNLFTAVPAIVNAPLSFFNTANVNVSGTNSTFTFNNTTLFNGGGSYFGAGTVIQNGTAIVNSDTTMDFDVWDLDGTDEDTEVAIRSGAKLTITSNRIEPTPGAGFSGTLNVNGGELAMNTTFPWILDTGGTMNLNTSLGNDPVVSGQTLTVRGNVNVSGKATIAAPVTFIAGSSLSVPAATDELLLTGAVTYSAGSYTGLGTIHQNGPAHVIANTTLNFGVFDWDGNNPGAHVTTIDSGDTLTINASKIDAGDPLLDGYSGTANVSGVLAVNTPAPWRLDAGGAVNLLAESAQLNGTQVQLFGTIANTAPGAATGDTTVNAPVRNRGGTIHVASAKPLRLTGAFSSEATATLMKTGAGLLIVEGAQSHDNASGMIINGGTVQMNTDPGGGAPGAGSLGVYVNNTSALVLKAPANGLATLGVGPGGRVEMSGGGLGATLVTRILQVGSSGALKGEFDIGDDALVVDYAGGSPIGAIGAYVKNGYNGGSWDGKFIDSAVAAADPTKATAVGFGETSDLLGLSGAQTGQFMGRPVDATAVLVRFTLYGDANLDGAVDFNDMARLAQNYNSSGKLWAHGDFTFDGVVDFNDMARLAQNYNTSLPEAAMALLPAAVQSDVSAAFAAAHVPEPGAAGAALLAGTIALAGRRRRGA